MILDGEIFKDPIFAYEGRTPKKRYIVYFSVIMAYGVLLWAVQAIFPDMELPGFLRGSKYATAILGFILFSPFVILVLKSFQRCHDLGVSAFYTFIPFFFLLLLLVRGQNVPNRFGDDPEKKDEPDGKITLLNRGTTSVAINKTATFKMFLLLLVVLSIALIVYSYLFY